MIDYPSMDDEFETPPAVSDSRPGLRLPGVSLLESLRDGWQVDELAAQIGLESQARVAFAGLDGAGKRLLYNRLRGWVMEWPERTAAEAQPRIEPVGLFVLADLPETEDAAWWQQWAALPDGLMLALGDPALVVYLIDGLRGITQADHRWVAALRTSGRPLVVALNKVDLGAKCRVDAATASERLGMPVIPIAALTGLNVETRLLPAMLNAAPKLAIPLGREIAALRRDAARRVIRQAALLAGVLGVQPIPGLELPFLALLHAGVVLRIGAAHGYQPGGGVSREVIGTVGAVVALQYAGQTVAKLVPIVGSFVGGALSAATTLMIGEMAIRYYEAGASLPVGSWWTRFHSRAVRWRGRLPRVGLTGGDKHAPAAPMEEITVWDADATATDQEPAL